MSERNNKLELLGSAPIPKALMALGIPIMIGMLINALYNLVDAYFVGGLGESQMGAISVVFPLGQVVVGLGLMFGNGAASYLSRLLGRGDSLTHDPIIPPDGERKKPLPGRLFLCALFHIPAAVLRNQDRRFCFAYSMQDRQSTEETTMLIQSVYQLYSLSKKAYLQHGKGLDKKMYNTV